ncbi:hypothetical protein B0H13DRAFT_2018324 [Mycena leptocephala]|nr:hypothetical protein B0H13DRAFT_2018324 [Mycena leptocephala]
MGSTFGFIVLFTRSISAGTLDLDEFGHRRSYACGSSPNEPSRALYYSDREGPDKNLNESNKCFQPLPHFQIPSKISFNLLQLPTLLTRISDPLIVLPTATPTYIRLDVWTFGFSVVWLCKWSVRDR